MMIRHAKFSDVSNLIKLDMEAHRETKWWRPMTKQEFSKLIRKRNMLFVAENHELVGYISGSIDKKNVILENVYVKKNFRRKKIAKMLIGVFMNSWKKSKYKSIRLNCPERLRKFYTKFGFSVTSLVMKKDI